MLRTLMMAAVAVLIATSAQGDSLLLLMGIGGAGGSPLANCGTGVIDTTAGCTLPIALGLLP